MRMISCAIGALLLAAGTVGAQAPGARAGVPLTLAEARAMARQNSPELAAARQALTAAEARERQAGAFPNPVLSYAREQTSRTGESNWQDVFSVDQPLEIGGQRGARRDAAGFLRASAQARLAATAARVDFEVARSYAAAVAAERRAVLADEASQAFGKARQVSVARLAEGDVSGYEHRRLRLEAARYQALRLEALVARDGAVRVLASLLGRTDSAGQPSVLLVDTVLPAPLAPDADSLVALALANQGELRAAELESQAGQAEARRASAARIPIPVLIGGYKSERLTTGETLDGFVAGVSLPLPIWDRQSGQVEAAEADAARQAAEVATLRRQTVREVRAAFDAHQALAGQLTALDAELGAEAASARRSAATAYAEGELSLLEWLDSVRAYQEAESTYITLWSEYIARRAALERATGATLF